MTVDLKASLDRFVDGSYTDADIAALRRALQTGQIALATGERAVAAGGDVTDAVIVTGYGNVVHVYKGVDAETIRRLFDQTLGDVLRTRELETPQQVQQLVCRYRESIGNACQYLEATETPLPPDMDVRVELQRAYTKLRVQSRDSSVTIGQALNSSPAPKLLIVGESGAGKSVLLRLLAQVYARRMAHSTFWVARSENNVLPILFKLRECSHPDGLWKQVLAGATRGLLPLSADIVQRALEREAAGGRAFLLLDGLDEVFGSHRQRAILEVLQQMTCAYPSLRVIVTSRPLERRGQLENLQRLEMIPLSSIDISAFTQYWLEALARAGAFSISEVECRKKSLVARVEDTPHLRGLASNPFSLTVLVLLVGFEGIETDLPQGWLQLLRRYLQFYWWWETERRGLEAPMEKDNMLKGLYLICYYLKALSHCRERTLEELTGFLTTSRSMSPTSASDTAERLLSFWVRTGMLHYDEVDDHLYLKHSLFQEYGIAQALTVLPKEAWRHSEEAHLLPEWRKYSQWASIIRARKGGTQ